MLLLDEPLSALDLKLRQLMRAELRAIQKRTGVTFVYITHDQSEALAMSDRVGGDERGRRPAGRHAARALRDEPRTGFRRPLRRRDQRVREGRVVDADAAEAMVEDTGSAASPRAPEPACARGGRATVYVRPEALALDGPCR